MRICGSTFELFCMWYFYLILSYLWKMESLCMFYAVRLPWPISLRCQGSGNNCVPIFVILDPFLYLYFWYLNHMIFVLLYLGSLNNYIFMLISMYIHYSSFGIFMYLYFFLKFFNHFQTTPGLPLHPHRTQRVHIGENISVSWITLSNLFSSKIASIKNT